MKKTTILCILLFLFGCTNAPQGITPIKTFDLDRYLGTWYEIARLDHKFERGLSQVSANYNKRPDGGIDVINRGYNGQTGKWKEALGRAYPLGDITQGSLKVSFFWPFYAGYHLIDLDQKDYSYALVCGPSRDYLWILSRAKTLDRDTIEHLIAKARALNFATDSLIFVKHAE